MIDYLLFFGNILRIVLNLGDSGDSTDDIITRMSSITSNDFNISVCMIGTNDFLNSAKLNSTADFETNYNSIITSLKVKGDVILLSIPPCIDDYLYNRHTYPEGYAPNGLTNFINDTVNPLIQQIAVDNDIGFFDIFSIFTENGDPKETEDSYLRNLANTTDADGVHPTAIGYDIIAYKLARYITSSYPNSNKIACIGNSITYGLYVTGEGGSGISDETYPGRLNYYLNK